MASALYLGLMSGTSMDGVDAVLCEFRGTRLARTSRRHSLDYPAPLRARLLHLQREEPAITIAELCELDNAVARVFADTANGLLQAAGIPPSQLAGLGSHGQTVYHDPKGVGSSLQLGNPSLIAAMTGVTTVADFRRADIAHGGQGAPLVPAFHRAQFADAAEVRSVVNIGGIANISVLRGAQGPVLGFDTGPGNGLMDEWIERHLDKPYDADGAWARSGTPHAGLLDALLSDPYFATPPPKSTGRNQFNLGWAQRRYPDLLRLPPPDVQASFCELTVHSIATALQRCAADSRRLLVCGGGALNGFLLHRLRECLPGIEVQSTDEHGLGTSDVEAAAFAWLAMRTLEGLPGNLPAATGAHAPAILGGIYRA